MKNLKKVLALVMALCMLFCFVGCAKSDDESSSVADTAADKPATVEPGAATPDADDKIDFDTVTDGKLIMATNAYFAPYEFYEGDDIVGIDAEIAAAIAEKLGLELEIRDMNFDTIITAVNAGDADIGVAGMTVTEDRLKEVDFSVSYANGVQAIIVKEGSPIKTADDLFADGATYKVGVQLGTTGDIYCSDDLGEDRVTQYANGNEAIVALQGGDVDCVVIDNQPALNFVANNDGLVILETSYADEDYAIAIKKGNTELRDAIDQAIEELIEEGKIDEILAKYIK